MGTVRQVARNTGVVIGGRIAGELIGLVTAIFFVRYLGANNLGVYSFVFAYLIFFNIITDLGLTDILVRDISRDRTKADKFIGNGIIISIALSLCSIGLACLIISLTGYPFNIKVFVYIASLMFLFSFRNVYKLIFQVDLRMGYPILALIASKAFKLVLFLYLIFIKASLVWFVIGEVLVILPEFLIILYSSKGFIKPKFQIDFKMWKYILKESWPVALMAVFIIIYHRIDQLMLFNMRGAVELGYYSAAVKLPEALVIFPAAFMMSAYPLMSRYFKTSPESLTRAYTLSFKYLLMLAIPIAMGATILAKPIISLIYGEKFLPSVPDLSILCWAEVLVFYGFVHYEIMVAVGKQRLFLLFTGTGAIANVILNLVLIPKYGIVGASIATLVSRIFSGGLIIGHLLPATRAYNIAGSRLMLRPMVASLIMGAYVYYTRSYLAPAIIGGAVIFIFTMLLIRGIDREDIRLAKAVFRKEGGQ